jgi:hypothetical protein
MEALKVRQSVAWLAAELVVVIAGILLAVAIDSWWQNMAELDAEDALLEALRVEFELNSDALSQQLTVYGRRQQAAETLLDLGPTATGLSPDSLNTLWQWVLRGGSFDAATGVLDATLASGDLQLIHDLELRSSVAAWPAWIVDFNTVEGHVSDLLFDHFLPWIRLNTAVPAGAYGELGIPPPRGRVDFALLSSSVVVENHLREIVAWGRILDQAGARIQEFTGGIIDDLAGPNGAS